MSKKIKCIIDEVKFKHKDFLSPMLVTFQHGELLPEKASTLKCTVLTDNKKNRFFSLESGVKNISYKGSPSSDNNNTCKTMLAIRNRDTNKVTLIEYESMILAPVIQKEERVVKLRDLSYTEKMKNLAHTFGSKRGKRVNEQLERSRSEKSELNDEMKGALDSVDVSFMDLKQDSAAGGIPWNPKATTIAGVYQLYDLISKEQLKSLKQEARHVKNTAVDSLANQYSPFLVASLPLILEKDASNKKQLKQDLEALVYIDYLIMHAKCNYNKPFADNEKICTASTSVNKKLIEEFSLPGAGNTRLCTTAMKDKASCHVIVLAMLLLDYQVCLKQLATSLNHTLAKLKTFSQALGASCPKDSTVATLRFPLVLSRPRGMAKRKRR